MDFKQMTIEYLFYYMNTVCSTIDIEEDIFNLCEYMNEYENTEFDFNEWLNDNDLKEKYLEYTKGL